MSGTSFPKAKYDLSQKLIHVLYEMKMYLYCRTEVNNNDDSLLKNAFIETTFLHARNLFYFFKSNQLKRKDDDMYCQDYGYSPIAGLIKDTTSVGKEIEKVHKRIMHLTADRVDNVNWQASAIQPIDRFILPLIEGFLWHIKESRNFALHDRDLIDINELLKLLGKNKSTICGMTNTSSDSVAITATLN